MIESQPRTDAAISDGRPSGADLPLDRLVFDNRFTAVLPADRDPSNGRRQVTGAAFSRVAPTPVAAPVTLAWSPEVAAVLGLDDDTCRSDDFADVFGGNRVPLGADPFAACYGGHQFGNWAGQLGDGRAIALGEVIAADGTHQTMQLKGAGATPYSRGADGRAVLRSSIREFLCSEAMHHLGVPTTRALALVATGDGVMRDVLYDGHPEVEPGAVVCRVAPSFTRFGTFQLPASRGDIDLLRSLVHTTITTDFAHLLPDDNAIENEARLVGEWFAEVCRRTATLAVHWMRVGFVHGVLNTDNMSILGLTIDYGPYGWLEVFEPGWTPNTTDAGQRRYRFGAQPAVTKWNLAQLAEALLPLTPDPAVLQAGLVQYDESYQEGFQAMMFQRLGWGPLPGDGLGPDEAALVNELFALMTRTETDYVLFFRQLAHVPVHDTSDDALLEALDSAWYQPDEVTGELRSDVLGWLRRWAARAVAGGLTDAARRASMDAVNPRFVLRNWMAQEAIDAATGGDTAPLHELLDVLRHPYDEQPGRERFAARRPEWARHKVGCSMLSCSS